MIEPESIRGAVVDLGEEMLAALDGYGANAYVTGLALVARVRFEPTAADPTNTGQTLLASNIAGNDDAQVPEADRRTYLIGMLEDAIALSRHPRVDLDDLPPLD